VPRMTNGLGAVIWHWSPLYFHSRILLSPLYNQKLEEMPQEPRPNRGSFN
jgi:hypothetical protein